MIEFRSYFNQLYPKIEEGIQLVIKGKTKKDSLLIYRCFVLDLFKKEKGYEVVAKTFAKDSPPYAEKVVGNDAAGNSGYYRDKTVEYGPV